MISKMLRTDIPILTIYRNPKGNNIGRTNIVGTEFILSNFYDADYVEIEDDKVIFYSERINNTKKVHLNINGALYFCATKFNILPKEVDAITYVLEKIEVNNNSAEFIITQLPIDVLFAYNTVRI